MILLYVGYLKITSMFLIIALKVLFFSLLILLYFTIKSLKILNGSNFKAKSCHWKPKLPLQTLADEKSQTHPNKNIVFAKNQKQPILNGHRKLISQYIHYVSIYFLIKLVKHNKIECLLPVSMVKFLCRI